MTFSARHDLLRRRRRRRLARLRQHAARPEGRLLRAPLVGGTSPTGRPSSRRTTRPRKRMLGPRQNPHLTRPTRSCATIAKDIGPGDSFEPTDVAVYFGEPGKTVPDPYFGGKGPERTGCTLRRVHDRLPPRRQEHARQELPVSRREARPDDPRRDRGHRRALRSRAAATASRPQRPRSVRQGTRTFTADNVVFAGGVLGTVPSSSR